MGTRRIPSVVVFLLAATAVARIAAQEIVPSGQHWQISGVFQKSEPGPLEQRAKPVTSDNPIPRRTRLVRPAYPPEAASVGVRATVTLRVTVDHLGTVGEVRTVGVPIVGAIPPGTLGDEHAFRAGLLALVRSAKDAVGQWVYQPPADAPIAFDVVIGFSSDGDGDVLAQAAGRDSLPGFGVPQPSDRNGGGAGQPRKVTHVNPVYPPAARAAGVSGIVILEAAIGSDGRVLDARVLRSIPELDGAAVEAVKQWEFTPTLINGTPTPVTMTVTIQFSLP